MRIEGKVTKWNDDRGFGFIAPDQGGKEVFVHISAFPKDGQRPVLGERLSFEVEADRGGQPRAVNLVMLDRQVRPRVGMRSRRGGKPGGLHVSRLILIVSCLLVGAGFGYRKWTEPAQAFRCDGRTSCSQMTSCAEAKFFLKNCPDTHMDGNHDGVPCEQQWCTGPFAK